VCNLSGSGGQPPPPPPEERGKTHYGLLEEYDQDDPSKQYVDDLSGLMAEMLPGLEDATGVGDYLDTVLASYGDYSDPDFRFGTTPRPWPPQQP